VNSVIQDTEYQIQSDAATNTSDKTVKNTLDDPLNNPPDETNTSGETVINILDDPLNNPPDETTDTSGETVKNTLDDPPIKQ